MNDSQKDQETRISPEPNERLVPVFDAKEESEALVVRGLLESQGIEAMISGSDVDQEIWPGVGGSVIRVREERAADARRIIAEYRDAPPLEEADLSDDSAATG
ncbi:MAG TPA: DUF2007 domain-containing protein [Terriglobales bacterium]|jgi:hypothetical protein|nr:DUF2007 domain-containing protein [Terriglobales bacterium]